MLWIFYLLLLIAIKIKFFKFLANQKSHAGKDGPLGRFSGALQLSWHRELHPTLVWAVILVDEMQQPHSALATFPICSASTDFTPWYGEASCFFLPTPFNLASFAGYLW